MNACIVTPWHNPDQRDRFCAAWNLGDNSEFIQLPDKNALILERDSEKRGCALTKNKGIDRAIRSGADIIIVLDDDCFPSPESPDFETLIAKHVDALRPQEVDRFRIVTNPPSRGSTYFNRTLKMPVAASMGFWLEVGDYDAPSQLVHGARHPMTFVRKPVFGDYFPLCGMNLGFCAEWWPYCQFIDVPRYDDIWQGFIWQRRAYELGYCFNLNGPLITHSRQSNVWQNLRDEAVSMEKNEALWERVAKSKSSEYQYLVGLLRD